MAENKPKDLWDKLASVTPLVLGIAVTGVGAAFTHIYNFRQLQLNQIAALDKLRPLLTSEKPDEREFGYASFAALGYEDVAVRMIQLKKDESGRTILVELQQVGSPQVQARATDALESLDAMQKLVNMNEFGKVEPSEAELKNFTAEDRALFTKWARDAAGRVGISSKLGIAILYDTVVQVGVNRAQKLETSASASVSLPLGTREKEAAWLKAFLDERDQAARQAAATTRLYPALKKRIDRLRGLLDKGDWNLSTVTAPGSASRDASGAGAPLATQD